MIEHFDYNSQLYVMCNMISMLSTSSFNPLIEILNREQHPMWNSKFLRQHTLFVFFLIHGLIFLDLLHSLLLTYPPIRL